MESNFEFEEDKDVELTYSEEQKELKESFKAAAEQEGGPEGEEEEGGLLVLRNKTEKEKVTEIMSFEINAYMRLLRLRRRGSMSNG